MSDLSSESVMGCIFRRVALDRTHGVQNLCKLSMVSKSFHEAIGSDEQLWKTMATTLSPQCFPDRSSYTLLFSATENGRSSWQHVCKLFHGWNRGLTRLQELQPPNLFEELSTICKQTLPPIPSNCKRHFILGMRGHRIVTDFLVHQRYAPDLPLLQQSIVTSSSKHESSLFTILDAQRPYPVDICADFKSYLQMKKGYFDISPLHKLIVASESLTKEDNGKLRLIEGDSVGGRTTVLHNQEGGDPTFWVTHNVHGDLWICSTEPDMCVYWKPFLVYCKVATNRKPSLIQCIEINTNKECWSINVDLTPRWLLMNSQFVAIISITPPSDPNSNMISLLLLDNEKGCEVRSLKSRISYDSTVEDVLITDAFLLVSFSDRSVKTPGHVITVHALPTLEPKYMLRPPLLYPQESVAFLSLSICGRYLGVSTDCGDFLIYDMLLGGIRYKGSSLGYGPRGDYEGQAVLGLTRWKVGDGIWLWYKDVAEDMRGVVNEQILFWELKDFDEDMIMADLGAQLRALELR